MGWTAILGVLFCFGLASSSLYTAHSRYKLSRTNYARIALLGRHGSLTSALQKNSTYSVKYFEQRVDHFNAADQRTFKQRYLVNQEEWEEGGPILLYTGNEGDITWFCNNTVCTFELLLHYFASHTCRAVMYRGGCSGAGFFGKGEEVGGGGGGGGANPHLPGNSA